jgi:L-lactate dehydrogenase complex protein LldE
MPTVQLLVTCLVDIFFPEVGEATVAVLERAGCTVAFPRDQTCCGQPAFNAGFTDEAVAMAIHTVTVLDGTQGPIVVPSGSCADMVRHRIPELLDGTQHHAAATRVSNRTRELTEYLVDDLGETTVGAGTPTSVTYHASCHGLRGLGIASQPQQLIGDAPNVELLPLRDADQCCGFGGLFSVKQPDISTAMLDEKLANISATGADYVVATDVSCLMHIAGAMRRRGQTTRPCHIAELLAGHRP